MNKIKINDLKLDVSLVGIGYNSIKNYHLINIIIEKEMSLRIEDVKIYINSMLLLNDNNINIPHKFSDLTEFYYGIYKNFNMDYLHQPDETIKYLKSQKITVEVFYTYIGITLMKVFNL